VLKLQSASISFPPRTAVRLDQYQIAAVNHNQLDFETGINRADSFPLADKICGPSPCAGLPLRRSPARKIILQRPLTFRLDRLK
jgi:hypothetical protein